MGDPSWIADIAAQWPTLAWLVPVLLVAFYVVKFLSIAHEPVSKLFGSVGKGWRESAERKQHAARGEMGALRDEVRSLSQRVDSLLLKDEVNWAYVLYDEGWHRKYDFELISNGDLAVNHTPFPQFRKRWLRERGLTMTDLDYQS